MLSELNQRQQSSWSGFVCIVASIVAGLTGTASSNDQASFNGAACVKPQEVILLRGGIHYWPRAQAIADDLTARGFTPMVRNHWDFPCIANEIIRATHEGRREGDVGDHGI